MKSNLLIACLSVALLTSVPVASYSRGFGGGHGGFGGGFGGGGGGYHPGGYGGGGTFTGGGFHSSGYGGGYASGGFHGYSGSMGGGEIHSYSSGTGVSGFHAYSATGASGFHAYSGGAASFDRGLDSMHGNVCGAALSSAGISSSGSFGGNLPDTLSNTGLNLPTDMAVSSAASAGPAHGYAGSARGLVAANAPAIETIANRAAAVGTIPAGATDVAHNAVVTHDWSAADLRVAGNVVRAGLLNNAAFGQTWYNTFGGLVLATTASQWSQPAWSTLNEWVGSSVDELSYDYGDELTYEGDNVTLNGSPIATAAEYWQSASKLSDQGQEPPPNDAKWLPLGVFAATRGGETKSDMLFQLAVDKDGTIRGNYFNTAAKNAQIIEGAVDKLTQRTTWIVADRKDIIFDTGLYNLTRDETSILVHFGKDKTEQWLLVRLKEDSPNKAAK